MNCNIAQILGRKTVRSQQWTDDRQALAINSRFWNATLNAQTFELFAMFDTK